MADAAFLMRLLSVFRAERLRDLEGKPCWITSSHGRIHLVEPLLPDEGKPFDVDAWCLWKSAQPGMSAYKMLNGEKPPKRGER